MSHLAEVKSEVVDIDALRRALATMGLTLKEGGAPRFYYDQSEENRQCDYVVPLPGRYDLGLKKKDDGSYSFVCDNELLSGNFGRGKEGRELLGENAGKLINEYTWEVAKSEAAINNYVPERTFEGDEQVIFLTRY